MSPNSSSLSNVSFHPPVLSFLDPHFYMCSESAAGTATFTVTTFTYTSFLFLLPLIALVLYVGIQRRLAYRANTVSHSDFLTYNAIAMELIGLLASGLCCCGIYMQYRNITKAGVCAVFVVCLGRMLYQCLTCVEQYLAVIHPVTYLSLRTERGIKARNTSIGCIWLLFLVTLCSVVSCSPGVPTIPFFTAFTFGLIVISFCSLSVLSALIRPGPGDVGGGRKRVDHSKKKAFYSILAITAVLFLKYVGLLVCIALHASSLLDFNNGCAVLMSAFWFCLPSSLLLPLLFLYRAEKLPC